MKRADIARRRLVIDAAIRASRYLGHPYTHEHRAEIGLDLVIHDAENGYGHGVGRATARAARRDYDKVLALVVAALDNADMSETINRKARFLFAGH